MVYMVTWIIDPINISPMLAYIPYMDPMGLGMFGGFYHLQKVSGSTQRCGCHSLAAQLLQPALPKLPCSGLLVAL